MVISTSDKKTRDILHLLNIRKQMFRICLEHNVDQDGNEVIRAFVLLQVPNQTCHIPSRQRKFPFVMQDGGPKMTLQLFSIQMSLSLGAL